jgi:hypothetical protein
MKQIMLLPLLLGAGLAVGWCLPSGWLPIGRKPATDEVAAVSFWKDSVVSKPRDPMSSKPCASLDFREGFEKGARYALIVHTVKPDGDSIPDITAEAMALYWVAEVKHGHTLLGTGTLSTLSEIK